MSLKTATNAHYDRMKEDWQLARDFFELSGLGRYLEQGKYEAEGPYRSRVGRRFAQDHTATLVGRLADPMLLRADEVERDLGPIPDDYLGSAGPGEESHDLQMHQLAEYLLVYGEAWVEVRPTGAGAELRIRTPLSVPRWTGNRVLTLGEASRPDVPITQPEEVDTTYTVHSPRGFTTYMFRENETTGEEERAQVDSGDYSPGEEEAFFVDAQGNPTAPLLRVEMPWDATFGVAVARVHRSIYRMRNQLHGRFGSILTNSRYYTKGLDADGEEKLVHALKRGRNLLHLDENSEIGALEVPTDGIEEAQDELRRLKDDLYRAANQTIDGATSNASATEAVVKNEDKSAALATLAATIESAEESALRLIAQTQNIVDYGGGSTPPQDPGVASNWTDINWSQASVDLGE
ncbi:hypothetical protein GGQ13_003024 [Salinibacter ruber]|uniref:DUF4055 domain-containing protein n=1 Tax=Salinibacter ruber TaxID=146919 RepID=UPI00216A344F|nr:DUF4055 domain-containing protein [Salinibacter ruber]MCS4139569.1 hypothetical protein [Salinibacter ruber]